LPSVISAPGQHLRLPLLWLGLALLVVVLDQWTKGLASANLDYGRPLRLLPVLNFTLQHNSGAAFSFLSNAGGWQRWFFSVVAAVVSVVLLVWLTRLRSSQALLAASLALILGGALGNLIDRLVLGYVVDFVSVHYGGAYFPAFNVADSAISVGAGLMILDTILESRRGEQQE
jgi:signal peptidase II